MKIADKLILTVFGMFVTFWALGQEKDVDLMRCVDKLPIESVTLVTDRDYYLVGETLWFNAYVFIDGNVSGSLSKVLYVELFNNKKNVFIKQKFELENGKAKGNFTVPVEMNSGHYFIRAYTQYMRNFTEDQIFCKVLTIIHPQSEFSEVKPSEKLESEEMMTTVKPENPISFSVTTDQKKYDSRTPVSLSINGEIPSDLSIAVRRKGTGHEARELEQFFITNPWLQQFYPFLQEDCSGRNVPEETSETAMERLTWIPEIRGMTVTGMIRNKQTKKPVPDIYCISSVIGEVPQIHLSKTQKDGRFLFAFNHLEGEKDIFVAIRNDENRENEILINKDFSLSFPPMEPMILQFEKEQHALFEELYINAQLNQTFEMEEQQSAFPEDSPLPPAFNIGSPDLVVDIKEFIDIPTMPEIFRELIPSVTVRGKVGSRKLTVFDRDVYRSYDNPVVLLDNVPVTDIEKMLQLDPAKLKSIEVFNSNYFLGDYLFGGLISIRTNTEDFAGYKWTDESIFLPFSTISRSKAFEYPIYQTTSQKLDKKPDFRTLLFWNPEVQMNREKQDFTFYTSDATGTYEVIVRGFSSDGRPCIGVAEFEVVR